MKTLGSGLLSFENMFPDAPDNEDFNRFDRDDCSDLEEPRDDPCKVEKSGNTIRDWFYDCMRDEIEGNPFCRVLK